jgi:hypothetical protein
MRRWFFHPESDCYFQGDRHPSEESSSFEASCVEEVEEHQVPLHIRKAHMAQVDWNTSENQVAEPRNFDPIPKGRYLVVLEDTEMKKTKDRGGEYLECTFTVAAPKEFKGRKLWARLNIKNASEVAQRIGREQFNALAIATLGTIEVRKTESMHNKKLVVHVAIEQQEGREPQNRINGFEPFTGDAGTSAPAPQQPPKPAPAPAPDAAKQKPADDFEDDIPF